MHLSGDAYMDYLNKIPKKNKDLAWRIIDNEAMIIFLNDQPEIEEKINILNETATRVWELVDGRNSVAGIIKRLTYEYDVKSGKACSQIKSLLINLSKKRWIYF